MLRTWKTVLALNGLLFCAIPTTAEIVSYEVTFDAVWSAATHPQDYPAGSHFSGLIGATHSSNVSFWQQGDLATTGIKRMAELGSKSLLSNEISTAIDAGDAFSIISGGGIGSSPGSVTQEFEISTAHPLVTIVSMIAPSPDWFVGVSGINLYEGNSWTPSLTIDLFAYDAGTDSGSTYRSANLLTSPPQAIQRITDSPFDNAAAMGTLTFRLVPEPSSAALAILAVSLLLVRRCFHKPRRLRSA